MITYAQIAELSDETSLPLIEIIRALARCAGDSEAARLRLTDGGHVDVVYRKVAENLAAALIEEGQRFSCEVTEEDLWRFCFPSEYVARAGTISAAPHVRALADDWQFGPPAEPD
jgi:hypothetical protein